MISPKHSTQIIKGNIFHRFVNINNDYEELCI